VNDCRPRFPLRRDDEVIDHVALLTARVSALVDGVPVDGFSADVLMPGWLDRSPAKTAGEKVEALARSARDAGWAFEGSGSGTLFEVWQRARGEHAAREGAALVLGFGLALVERAAMDAVCRSTELPFLNALKWNVFGFDPGTIHPELAGWNMSASVESVPAKRVRVRHTIGPEDPLRSREAASASFGESRQLGSLDQEIERYGLNCFKVRLTGDLEADVGRLEQLAVFLPAACSAGFDLMLDGDERYDDLDVLRELLVRIPEPLAERIEHVAQPFDRTRSFQRAVGDLPKALLLDAGDDAPEAFPRALAAGYRGVSVRSCKGVFRSLLNLGLCELHPGSFLSAEDQLSLPVLSLQQGLATIAALGLPQLELSCHRHFAGLEHLPGKEALDALRAHPDLYEQRDDGIYLRITNGLLSLGSIRCLGYGTASTVEFEAGTLLADWTPA